jgi:hypothetical protein
MGYAGGLEVARVHDRERMRRKRAFVRAFKADRGCQRCPERDVACLELHHRDRSTKHPKIDNKANKGWRQSIYNLGWDAMEAELAKCDVLCANCHAKLEDAIRRAQYPDARPALSRQEY